MRAVICCYFSNNYLKVSEHLRENAQGLTSRHPERSPEGAEGDQRGRGVWTATTAETELGPGNSRETRMVWAGHSFKV